MRKIAEFEKVKIIAKSVEVFLLKHIEENKTVSELLCQMKMTVTFLIHME